jgi:hypothetical protein
MENVPGMMDLIMKGSGKMVNVMERVYILKKTECFIRVNG